MMRRSLALLAGRSTAAALSFVANFYLARALGPDAFGRYAFAIALLTFVSIFFDFGFFSAGARLLVDATGEAAGSILAGMFALAGMLSLAFIALALLLGFTADLIFRVDVGDILVATAALAPALILPYLFEQSLKATGRITLLAGWIVAVKALFLAAVAVLALTGLLTSLSATAAHLGAGVLGGLLLVAIMAPSLRLGRGGLQAVAAEQKRFGRPLYVGKVAHLGSYHTDKLLLAAFRNAAEVGWYSLAMSLAGAVSMLSQSIAAASFRDFGGRRAIEPRLLRWNVAGIAAASALTLAIGLPGVWLYLGADYAPVLSLLVLGVIATALQAGYQPFNSWLLANGFGVEIRRFLFIVAAVNLSGNVILIPLLGAWGAALASILSMATYVLLARADYRREVAR